MTDWAALEQPNLKDRALAAYEKRTTDKRREWEDELFTLWGDAINFFRERLLFSEDEINSFISEANEAEYDPAKKNLRPSISWHHDGHLIFKIGYTLEQVAVVEADSGTRKEKIMDTVLHVKVNKGGTGWKEIESLADLGELLEN
jgi:hypothetical protein